MRPSKSCNAGLLPVVDAQSATLFFGIFVLLKTENGWCEEHKTEPRVTSTRGAWQRDRRPRSHLDAVD